jgi:hypothetical protein
MSNLWPPAVDHKAWCFRLENSAAQRLRLVRSGIWPTGSRPAKTYVVALGKNKVG